MLEKSRSALNGFVKKDLSRNCSLVSIDISIENTKLPLGSDFPNLCFLMIMLSTFKYFPEVFDANDTCFEGMEELNVLSFSGLNF